MSERWIAAAPDGPRGGASAVALRRRPWPVFVVLGGLLLAALLAGCGGPRMVQAEGQLADCERGDCVSSQASDPERFVKPLRYVGSAHAARETLVQAMLADGAEIVTNSQCYVHGRFDAALSRRQDVALWLCNRPGFIDLRVARSGGLFGGDDSRERAEWLRASLLPDPEAPLQR